MKSIDYPLQLYSWEIVQGPNWGVHHLHIEQQLLGTHYLMSSNNMTTRRPLKGDFKRKIKSIKKSNRGHYVW